MIRCFVITKFVHFRNACHHRHHHCPWSNGQSIATTNSATDASDNGTYRQHHSASAAGHRGFGHRFGQRLRDRRCQFRSRHDGQDCRAAAPEQPAGAGNNDGSGGAETDSDKTWVNFQQVLNQILNGKIIETVSWLGAALVVGLNFEAKLHRRRWSSGRMTCTSFNDISSNRCQDDMQVCSTRCPVMRRLVAFASPNPIKTRTFVLPERVAEESSSSSSTGTVKSEAKDVDESLKKKSAIETISDELKSYSIDYLEKLNNMLGLALIDKNPDEAIKCWSSCSRCSAAIFNLAVAYETGRHTIGSGGDAVPDLAKAFDKYQAAANLGHRMAVYNLALFYLNGRGVVDVDQTKADDLLRQAARLGVSQAKRYFESTGRAHEVEIDEIGSKILVKENSKDKPKMRTSSSVPNLFRFGQNNIFESMVKSRIRPKESVRRLNSDDDSSLDGQVSPILHEVRFIT